MWKTGRGVGPVTMRTRWGSSGPTSTPRDRRPKYDTGRIRVCLSPVSTCIVEPPDLRGWSDRTGQGRVEEETGDPVEYTWTGGSEHSWTVPIRS